MVRIFKAKAACVFLLASLLAGGLLKAQSVISGYITYLNTAHTPLDGIRVFLTNAGGQRVDSTYTDPTGYFSFGGVQSGLYYLVPVCDKNWGGAASNDALIIMKHFVGMSYLSGLSLTAADVDGTSSVNSMDALAVMKRFVGLVFSFASGDWAFDNEAVVVEGGGTVMHNITALCFGDVNGTYVPPACMPQPSIANAGPDQIDIGGIAAILSANEPATGDLGTWSILSGIDGTISDIHDPAAQLSGKPGQSYTLQWRISNHCGVSEDTIIVSFICPDPTVADAGPDQTHYFGVTAALTGNLPQPGETGAWSIVFGDGGSFSDELDPSSVFSANSFNYQLKWTISNGCSVSSDDVNIFFPYIMGFLCFEEPFVDYYGQSLLTVKIGYQCWLARNLDIGNMIPSSQVPANDGIYNIEKYCYNDDPANCAIYGGLYSWDEMMQYTDQEETAGICPFNWHIPSDMDWYRLTSFLDPAIDSVSTGWSGFVAGDKMKEPGNNHWNMNWASNNMSGFAALGSGRLEMMFSGLLDEAGFWTSTSAYPGFPYSRSLAGYTGSVGRNVESMNPRLAVRCVRDCMLPLCDAGPPLQVTSGNSIVLSAALPNTSEIGTWHVDSGSGGHVADIHNPVSLFTGIPGEDYVLRWTVVNFCGESFDRTSVSIICPDLSQVNAGQDLQEYPGDTLALSGSIPLPGETGTWSIIGGIGGSFSSVNNPAALFTGDYNVVYVLRWTISNACDSVYDEVVVSFREIAYTPCPGMVILTYGTQLYHTMKLGNQCWMIENLNIGMMRHADSVLADNNIMEKYCYENDSANCSVYGGLYRWDEMMDYTGTERGQGICPSGWHIPSEAEWKILSDSLGGDSIAGGRMKEVGFGHWASPNTGASDSIGFTGLPGGLLNPSAGFNGLTFSAGFWSSTLIDSLNAGSNFLSFQTGTLNRGHVDKDFALSVRCLRNNSLEDTLNTGVIIIDTASAQLLSDSAQLSQGIYSLQYNGVPPVFSVGNIIAGAAADGFLRKVTGVVSNTNPVTLLTQPADMIDLFNTVNFGFQAGLSQKNNLHGEGVTVPGSVSLNYLAKGVTMGKDGCTFDFSNTVIFQNNNLIFKITDGTAVFTPNFNAQCEIWRFKLSRFHFYTENSALSLNCNVNLHSDAAESIPFFDVTLADYDISVPIPGLPLFVVINIRLVGTLDLDLNAAVDVDAGFSNSYLATLGLKYEDNEWTSLYGISDNLSIFPVTFTGNMQLAQKLTINPRVSVLFYGVAGPYINPALYQRLDAAVTTPANDWDASLEVGLDAEVGVAAAIFGEERSFSKTFNFSRQLWNSPDKMEIIGGDNQQGPVGQPLPYPLTVVVMDTLGNPVAGVTVHFQVVQGGGSLAVENVVTGTSGNAATIWTLGQQPGAQVVSATIRKADGQVIAVRNFSANIIFFLGQHYGGGIIYYLDESNQHGLIASETDVSGGAPWGCCGTLIGTAGYYSVGSGQQATLSILSACSDPGTAAALCNQYSVTEDNILYDDWFLPSGAELAWMQIRQTYIGSFSGQDYWSSSECSGGCGPVNAWTFYIPGSGGDCGCAPSSPCVLAPGHYSKNQLLHVRAVRTF